MCTMYRWENRPREIKLINLNAHSFLSGSALTSLLERFGVVNIWYVEARFRLSTYSFQAWKSELIPFFIPFYITFTDYKIHTRYRNSINFLKHTNFWKKQHTSFPSLSIFSSSSFLFFVPNLIGGNYLMFVLIYIFLITSEAEYLLIS